VLEKDSKLYVLYGIALTFIALNAVFIAKEMYMLMAIPLAFAVMLLFFFSLDKLLLLLVFLTPLSFEYKNEAMGFAIDLPTEPIIVAIMGLFFLKLIYEQQYDRKVLKHPLTIVLIAHLVWMLITTFTSEIPVISIKYFVSRLWFVVAFYFVLIQLFKNPVRIQQFFWLFGVSLALIILYITIQHAGHGFLRQTGTWIVRPFFNDHTNYSAVIALIAPYFIVMAFYRGFSPWMRMVLLAIFAMCIVGVILSYSRASWVSIFLAFCTFWLFVFKINYKLLFLLIALFAGGLYTFQDEIIMRLERNRQDSSQDIREHVQSISNISSDASNLERINRWRAAYRLYQERPIVGWGPGTYQEVYAPFQLASDHTIITTNLGDMGNAHSEYLGPLAESGLLGMLLFIVMALMIMIQGIKNFRNAPNKEHRWTSMAITLGFITYFIHGFLNNFLDTDKASVLFWGFMAILVAIEVYHSPSKNLPSGSNK
jgi:putative inorganic carbon (hco3(-)) transporter